MAYCTVYLYYVGESLKAMLNKTTAAWPPTRARTVGTAWFLVGSPGLADFYRGIEFSYLDKTGQLRTQNDWFTPSNVWTNPAMKDEVINPDEYTTIFIFLTDVIDPKIMNITTIRVFTYKSLDTPMASADLVVKDKEHSINVPWTDLTPGGAGTFFFEKTFQNTGMGLNTFYTLGPGMALNSANKAITAADVDKHNKILDDIICNPTLSSSIGSVVQPIFPGTLNPNNPPPPAAPLPAIPAVSIHSLMPPKQFNFGFDGTTHKPLQTTPQDMGWYSCSSSGKSYQNLGSQVNGINKTCLEPHSHGPTTTPSHGHGPAPAPAHSHPPPHQCLTLPEKYASHLGDYWGNNVNMDKYYRGDSAWCKDNTCKTNDQIAVATPSGNIIPSWCVLKDDDSKWGYCLKTDACQEGVDNPDWLLPYPTPQFKVGDWIECPSDRSWQIKAVNYPLRAYTLDDDSIAFWARTDGVCQIQDGWTCSQMGTLCDRANNRDPHFFHTEDACNKVCTAHTHSPSHPHANGPGPSHPHAHGPGPAHSHVHPTPHAHGPGPAHSHVHPVPPTPPHHHLLVPFILAIVVLAIAYEFMKPKQLPQKTLPAKPKQLPQKTLPAKR